MKTVFRVVLILDSTGLDWVYMDLDFFFTET